MKRSNKESEDKGKPHQPRSSAPRVGSADKTDRHRMKRFVDRVHQSMREHRKDR